MLNQSEKIKVMIVDDSVLVRKYLSNIFFELGMDVVTTASDGKIALQKMELYNPDVIILDIEMPEMNGIEFLKHLKEKRQDKVPYVIVFSSLVEDGSEVTIEALNNGATELIKKPDGPLSENLLSLKEEFKIKIEELYNYRRLKEVKVEEKKYSVFYGIDNLKLILNKRPIHPEIIAIGSSTGGPVAIRKVLQKVRYLPVPVIIAQHMPAGFTKEFANNLANYFSRKIVEVSHNEILENGVIYICPGGKHARVLKSSSGFVYYEDTNNYEDIYFKPSVDILFQSLRESGCRDVLAIILTGMGRDGARESVNLRKTGAFVIAQDEESSAVWGMPGNAVKLGGVDIILNIDEIGEAINLIFSH